MGPTRVEEIPANVTWGGYEKGEGKRGKCEKKLGE
jgi:hypothetical protein